MELPHAVPEMAREEPCYKQHDRLQGLPTCIVVQRCGDYYIKVSRSDAVDVIARIFTVSADEMDKINTCASTPGFATSERLTICVEIPRFRAWRPTGSLLRSMTSGSRLKASSGHRDCRDVD